MSESGPSEPAATEPNRMTLNGSNSATNASTRTSDHSRSVRPAHTARLSRTANDTVSTRTTVPEARPHHETAPKPAADLLLASKVKNL